MGCERRGRLKGRVALVTGGSRGIGRAVCEKMLQEDASVAIMDIRGPELHETCKALSDTGKAVMGFVLDVSHRFEIEKAVAAIASSSDL